MASPHTITHDHTISVWFYDSGPRRGYVYECVRRREKMGRGGGSGQGSRHRHVRAKKGPFMYRQARRHKHRRARTRELSSMRTHTNTRSPTSPPNPTPPPPPAISLWPFLSLPLAVSQIPDDVLTGGLSDWRWGCVMTDQGPLSVTSTLPACCLKINWQIEPPPPPKKKTAAFPLLDSLPLYIFSFFFLFLLTPTSPAAGALQVLM